MTRRLVLPILLALFAATPALRPLAAGERVPMLIMLREQADLQFASAIPDKTQRGRAIFEALRRQAQRDQPPLLALLRTRGIAARGFTIINAISAKLDPATAELLKGHPKVASLMPDPPRLLHKPLEPEQPPRAPAAAQSVEWNIQDIRADQVWETYAITGSGVVVASNDTGVQWGHPALQRQYRGWNGTSAGHAYNWHDSIHEELSSPGNAPANPCGFNVTEPCDDTDHGTHTTGTMVGDDGAGNQIGVALGARWIACRNMEHGVGNVSTYLECFDWFLAPTDSNGRNPRPDLAPDIINNSWACTQGEGCTGDQISALEPAVQALSAAGILVVTSAGNQGSSCNSITNPPALYPDNLTVGAYDSNGALAWFSSRGPVSYNDTSRIGPDLTAPGVNIRSSINNGYGWNQGTSMAAPHVAGTAALLWSARPQLRGHLALTRQILQQTARPFSSSYTPSCGPAQGARPNNDFGWGRLDALAAVEEVLSTGTLSVTVRNAMDVTPVSGAEVQISGPYTLSLITDAAGQIELPLPDGAYTVTARHSSFGFDDRARATVRRNATTSLTFSLRGQALYLPLLSKGREAETARTTRYPGDDRKPTGAASPGSPPIAPPAVLRRLTGRL